MVLRGPRSAAAASLAAAEEDAGSLQAVLPCLFPSSFLLIVVKLSQGRIHCRLQVHGSAASQTFTLCGRHHLRPCPHNLSTL